MVISHHFERLVMESPTEHYFFWWMSILIYTQKNTQKHPYKQIHAYMTRKMKSVQKYLHKTLQGFRPILNIGGVGISSFSSCACYHLEELAVTLTPEYKQHLTEILQKGA